MDVSWKFELVSRQNTSQAPVSGSEMRPHYRDMYMSDSLWKFLAAASCTAEIYRVAPDHRDNDYGSVKDADSLFENNENAPAGLQAGVIR